MRKESKHTRGPWTLRWAFDDYAKSSEVTGKGKICEAIAVIPHDDVTDDGVAEVTANAKLIAAAPDMYEALKLYERSRNCKGPAWPDVDNVVRAALAKAGS